MEDIRKLNPEEYEEISPINEYARSTSFTEESFSDKKEMVYELSNKMVRSYPGITGLAESLLMAGAVCIRNIHLRDPYTEEEMRQGVECYVPIRHVARLMGYDEGNKYIYEAVKNAAIRLSNAESIVKENIDKTEFSVYQYVSQIDYNKGGNGRIYFKFSPASSSHFLSNKGDFTLQSLIITNSIQKNSGGRRYSAKLHEILRSELYKVKNGSTKLYIDYVDLRMNLNLINTNNQMVRDIINNPRYEPKNIYSSEAIAYERLRQIESLDVQTRENISQIKSSDDYKKSLQIKKSDVYKGAKKKLSKMDAGSDEYKQLFDEHIRFVDEQERKLRNQENNIVVQYSAFGDFKKRVLEPAKSSFMAADIETGGEMDLMFEYEAKSFKGSVIGVTFIIYTMKAYKDKLQNDGHQVDMFEYLQEKESGVGVSKTDLTIYKMTGGAEKNLNSNEAYSDPTELTIELFEKYIYSIPEYKRIVFSATEMLKICKLANFEVIKEKYDLLLKQKNLHSPIAWLISAIKEDFKSPPGSPRIRNSFQRSPYDFSGLEDALESLVGEQINFSNKDDND